MSATWESVASKPEYQALPPDQQTAARNQYFDSIVAPKVPQEHRGAARRQFEAHVASQSSSESEEFPDILSRRASEAWASRPSAPQPSPPAKTGADFVRNQLYGKTGADFIGAAEKAIGAGFGVLASPLGAAGERLEYQGAKAAGLPEDKARTAARATGDVSEALLGVVPGIKGAPKAAGDLATGAVTGVARKAGEAVNAVADRMGMPTVSASDKANAHIVKTLLKAGHSPDEIVQMMSDAKKFNQTAGEASANPQLLGEERKISGMNRPGGETIREHAGERVNPKNPASIPAKLKGAAAPMTAKMKAASKAIGETVESAPKYPVDMSVVRKSLKAEKIVPGSTVSTTLKRIDALSKWAKTQGDTFAAWHRVKQEIYALKAEAANPMAVEKLDSKTVNDYYAKVNDVLRGDQPGLPVGLAESGKKYKAANDTYRQNLAGDMIADVLEKMPTGGTPNQALKYLYNKLAGSPEAQEQLLGQMPKAQQQGVMKLLKAISESSRSGVSDVVKSGEMGTPSFPTSMQAVLGKMRDWLLDKIQRKDYDALAKAFTNPDVKEMAKQLGIKPPATPAPPAGQSANQAIGAVNNPLAAGARP